MILVVDDWVIVWSVVVRITTEVVTIVAFVGVTVTVVVDPLHAVVTVPGSKTRVWVCVPMVENTAAKMRNN